MTRRPGVFATAPGTQPAAFGRAEWGLMAAVALMWGASFLFIAVAVEAFAPPTVTLGRLGLGAIALIAFGGHRTPIDPVDRSRIVLLSLVWMATPLLLIPIAQQWVDSGIAGMINGGMPLFAGVFAALMLRRLPGVRPAVGLAAGFAGVLLISWPSASSAGGSPLGVGLILVATACYGLGVNLAVPLQHRYGALPVLLRAQAVSIAIVAPFGLAGVTRSSWSWGAFGAVAALGVLGTGLAYVAMAVLVGRAGATRGSIAIYFIPVVAVALGILLRQETVPAVAFGGLALVLLGAALTSRAE